jgi:hypothetical protein
MRKMKNSVMIFDFSGFILLNTIKSKRRDSHEKNNSDLLKPFISPDAARMLLARAHGSASQRHARTHICARPHALA